MPEEIFIIIIVGILAGTFSGIVAQIVGYLKSRGPSTKSEASLTTSELEGMIQKWIQEATRPLVSRIERIEDRLTGSLKEEDILQEKSILEGMDAYKAREDGELISRQQIKD